MHKELPTRKISLNAANYYGLDGPRKETLWGGAQGIFLYSTTCPDQPLGPPSLLKWVLEIFSGVRWLWCDTDHPPPLGAKVRTKYSNIYSLSVLHGTLQTQLFI
jgi:hypothetical protein